MINNYHHPLFPSFSECYYLKLDIPLSLCTGLPYRHSHESGNPETKDWIPAEAGMTKNIYLKEEDYV
jgi:hypothetical protein